MTTLIMRRHAICPLKVGQGSSASSSDKHYSQRGGQQFIGWRTQEKFREKNLTCILREEVNPLLESSALQESNYDNDNRNDQKYVDKATQ